MSKYIVFLIFLILINGILLTPSCEQGKNNCLKCNYINNLCAKCDKDIFSPDENGGCGGAKKCIIGKNYCVECSEEGTKCQNCDLGYFPDENGGCSYSDNCKISYKGECIQCKEDFILTGKNNYNNYILCKSLDSEDLQNCEQYDLNKGKCLKCKEGFYLNKGDNRCIETENCYESFFGRCSQCINGYYYDTKNNKCQKQEGLLVHCKKTLDGEGCDICEDYYYLAEDGNCILTNFCSKTNLELDKCNECISNYFLSKFNSYCVSTGNCYIGDKDTGLCLSCEENYYLDLKDGKCKSNKEKNEFFNCRFANNVCKECAYSYFLDEDSRCSNTKNCANSYKGKCNECLDKYYLGLDNKCTKYEHCIYSNQNYDCIECEDNFYFDSNKKMCIKVEKIFGGCAKTDYNGKICEKCKDGFYLNLKDHICYQNNEIGLFYGCEESDKTGKYCAFCKSGFYYGKKYNKCSKIEGCENFSDEKICDECNERYVLDLKTGKCEVNYIILDEEKKFYFKCNQTNEEGTECKSCVNELNLDDNGLCVDNIHCIEEKNSVCQKCEKKENEYLDYCLNSEFGCVETYAKNCLECNDILDLNKCTKCIDGYEKNSENNCIQLEK